MVSKRPITAEHLIDMRGMRWLHNAPTAGAGAATIPKAAESARQELTPISPQPGDMIIFMRYFKYLRDFSFLARLLLECRPNETSKREPVTEPHRNSQQPRYKIALASG